MRIFVLVAFFSLGCSPDNAETPVRATLADGQVLHGGVLTETLLLDTNLGRMVIPLAHVGEVVPVEAEALAEANEQVTLWLRNGSELRGRWAEPELQMGIAVGGRQVSVDLPMEQLERFQLQGDTVWPDGAIYRVKTIHGDDFFVDAEETRIVIENSLGVFEPTLAECVAVTPFGNASDEWRIVLSSGTVLIGPMKGEEIDFKLPMGPDHLLVERSVLVSMQQEIWYDADEELMPEMAAIPMAAAPIQADSGVIKAPSKPVYRTVEPKPAPTIWYDRSEMEAQKR